MKKLFVIAVLTALAFVACSSGVSDATRTEAGNLIEGISTSITSALEALPKAETAQEAAEVAEIFNVTLAAFTAKDTELRQNEDYFLISKEKSFLTAIDKLASDITDLKKSFSGESEAYPLAPFATAAARTMLADFEAFSVYPMEWLNASAEAKSLIEALTVLMDEAYVTLRDAKDSSVAAASLVTYANGVRELAALGTELEGKYPNFRKAPSNPNLERPIAEMRSAMVTLGREINEKKKEYCDDKDFNLGLENMKKIIGAAAER